MDNSPPSPLCLASLTVTELENFSECPKKFELKHIYSIEPLGNSPHGLSYYVREGGKNLTASQRGNLVHEIMQFFDPRRDNLEIVVEQALFNQHIRDPQQEFFAEAQELIKILKGKPKLWDILFNQQDSRQELEFALALNGFILNGQMDKIINRGTAKKPDWMVIDYKTHHGKSARDTDKLAEQFSFQMGCYALAVSRAFQQDKVDTLLLFTTTGQYRLITFDQEKLREFAEKLNELFARLIASVSENHFPLTEERKHCAHCLYYDGNYCGVKNLLK